MPKERATSKELSLMAEAYWRRCMLKKPRDWSDRSRFYNWVARWHDDLREYAECRRRVEVSETHVGENR